VGTNQLDLSVHDPDFVTISFYKMFGYPTGLGCLLVKKDVAHLLRQHYVAGGIVQAVAATDLFHELRSGILKFLLNC
jgi:molybdenum cofactor sulfurtransferase